MVNWQPRQYWTLWRRQWPQISLRGAQMKRPGDQGKILHINRRCKQVQSSQRPESTPQVQQLRWDSIYNLEHKGLIYRNIQRKQGTNSGLGKPIHSIQRAIGSNENNDHKICPWVALNLGKKTNHALGYRNIFALWGAGSKWTHAHLQASKE